jgi:hypothetical protein
VSKNLAKFQSTYKFRVDPELAARWDFDARSNGEKHIKVQIAQAKRTATALKKAAQQFSNIRPEQELAIRAAVSAMQALVSDLQPLVPWAKAYKAFCEEEYRLERDMQLEAMAQGRWGHDERALKFESDLVLELSTPDGKRTFAHWLHSTGSHTDVPLDRISSCIETNRSDALTRKGLAALIQEEWGRSDNKWVSRQGPNLICSWRTYELYLSHRKDIAAQTTGLLKDIAA